MEKTYKICGLHLWLVNDLFACEKECSPILIMVEYFKEDQYVSYRRILTGKYSLFSYVQHGIWKYFTFGKAWSQIIFAEFEWEIQIVLSVCQLCFQFQSVNIPIRRSLIPTNPNFNIVGNKTWEWFIFNFMLILGLARVVPTVLLISVLTLFWAKSSSAIL